MKLGKLFFLLCLPALIWNAPLISSTPSQKRPTFCPWDLLKFENLSYDDITSFIETVEYGYPSQFFDKAQCYEVLNFVTFLARNGISSWDTAAQEELEKDVEWLFSDEDDDKIHPWWSLSAWTTKEFSIVPAVFQSNEKVQILRCENWLSKKWYKTKKFIKKHKKPIIIATAVIVVATVVIVATGGTAAAPLAGAAAAAGAAGSNSPGDDDHPHINKPGDVRVQDDAPPQEIHTKDPPLADYPMNGLNTNQSLPTCPQVETMENRDAEALSETIQYHSEVIKKTLLEELPSEAFNVPSGDEPTFWENAANKTKEVTSWLAHDALKDTAECIGVSNETAHEYHEKIDEIFGTDHASQYTPEALEKEPKIVKGVLPPPGGSLTTTAKRVATIAGSTGIATGAAAAGSALTKTSLSLPLNSSITLSTEDVALDRMAEAGKAHDREGLTKAGRSLQKHGERPETVFSKPSGSVPEVNEHGQETLENILNHQEKTIVMRNTNGYGIVIDVHAPEVGGARYDKNGNFIGFLEPTQGMNSE